MKNLNNLLLVAFVLMASFCFGQILPFTENGLTISYDGPKKIGTRYDEYCKTTFDIYKVKGIVINANSDKAAHVKAILNFEGHTCNKIYGENGPSGGEVINKIYTLNIPLQTKHQSQYWVNRFVSLLPQDSMSAEINVEVVKDEECPDPSFSFSYELVDSKGNVPDSKTEATLVEEIPEIKTSPKGNFSNYSTLILGDWYMDRATGVDNGREVALGFEYAKDSFRFGADGNAIHQAYSTKTNVSWNIENDQLNLTINGSIRTFEIERLDGSSLLLKDGSGPKYLRLVYIKK